MRMSLHSARLPTVRDWRCTHALSPLAVDWSEGIIIISLFRHFLCIIFEFLHWIIERERSLLRLINLMRRYRCHAISLIQRNFRYGYKSLAAIFPITRNDSRDASRIMSMEALCNSFRSICLINCSACGPASSAAALSAEWSLSWRGHRGRLSRN